MPMTPFEVVEAVYEARRRRDIGAVLALCTDAIVFTVNADPDRPGSGNTMIGKAQSQAFLELVDEVWEPVSSAPGPLREVGQSGAAEVPGGAAHVRCVITFALRHRASGQILNGTKTHEWVVRDGRVTSLCETLDRNFIHAFMEMAAWSTRLDEQGPPTAIPDRPTEATRAGD